MLSPAELDELCIQDLLDLEQEYYEKKEKEEDEEQ